MIDDLRHKSAADIFTDSDVVQRAIAVLSQEGFFSGAVALAVFTFPPFLQEHRKKAGGILTASTFPIRLGNGDVGMMSIIDHDTFAPTEEDGFLSVTWLSAVDGHSHTVRDV